MWSLVAHGIWFPSAGGGVMSYLYFPVQVIPPSWYSVPSRYSYTVSLTALPKRLGRQERLWVMVASPAVRTV